MHNFPSPKTNKNEDSQAKTQFQLPLGGKHGLFLASTLDKLWKIIQLKIDDILLHQKDMIRDEIRLKMTEVMRFIRSNFMYTFVYLPSNVMQYLAIFLHKDVLI